MWQKAAKSSHYQARALPELVAREDFKTLANVATDVGGELNSRLGAIEALAAMTGKKAQQALVDIGTNKKLDEELRRAAWRGLRRSKRRSLKK